MNNDSIMGKRLEKDSVWGQRMKSALAPVEFSRLYVETRGGNAVSQGKGLAGAVSLLASAPRSARSRQFPLFPLYGCGSMPLNPLIK